MRIRNTELKQVFFCCFLLHFILFNIQDLATLAERFTRSEGREEVNQVLLKTSSGRGIYCSFRQLTLNSPKGWCLTSQKCGRCKHAGIVLYLIVIPIPIPIEFAINIFLSGRISLLTSINITILNLKINCIQLREYILYIEPNILVQVRQRAEEIDLSSLTTENFNSLLSELFSDGGVTQVDIVGMTGNK